jgi:hypothetical protein
MSAWDVRYPVALDRQRNAGQLPVEVTDQQS